MQMWSVEPRFEATSRSLRFQTESPGRRVAVSTEIRLPDRSEERAGRATRGDDVRCTRMCRPRGRGRFSRRIRTYSRSAAFTLAAPSIPVSLGRIILWTFVPNSFALGASRSEPGRCSSQATRLGTSVGPLRVRARVLASCDRSRGESVPALGLSRATSINSLKMYRGRERSMP